MNVRPLCALMGALVTGADLRRPLDDGVIWDNRCTMHHANADYPLDQKRSMHRVLIAGEHPV